MNGQRDKLIEISLLNFSGRLGDGHDSASQTPRPRKLADS